MSESSVDDHAALVNNIHYACAANDHRELAPGRNSLSPLTIYPTTLAEITRLMRSST